MVEPEKLKEYYAIVEKVIGELRAPVGQCRSVDKNGIPIPGQWNLSKGSARIFVDVYTAEEGVAYFCVASPVMKTTGKEPGKLYEKLLTLNHQMYSSSFSIYQGWVWLRILRECEGMDESECRRTFDRVGWYADRYDDELKKEFGE